jgi:hypothetical protein
MQSPRCYLGVNSFARNYKDEPGGGHADRVEAVGEGAVENAHLLLHPLQLHLAFGNTE